MERKFWDHTWVVSTFYKYFAAEKAEKVFSSLHYKLLPKTEGIFRFTFIPKYFVNMNMKPKIIQVFSEWIYVF